MLLNTFYIHACMIEAATKKGVLLSAMVSAVVSWAYAAT